MIKRRRLQRRACGGTCGAIAVAALAAILLGASTCCAIAVATLSVVLGHCCEFVPEKICDKQRSLQQAVQNTDNLSENQTSELFNEKQATQKSPRRSKDGSALHMYVDLLKVVGAT